MRTNVDFTRGLVMAESVSMRLAQTVGKHEAHTMIERAAARATDEHRSFADVLSADPAVAQVLSRSDLDQLLSPDGYLGSAQTFVANVLARHRRT